MSTFATLCSDFYVNQKLGLKLDLPDRRETVLDLFDRIRRAFPRLNQFQRYESEVALESAADESDWQWVALRQTSIRSGHVNPASMADAYQFHKAILEVAPYFLSISPLDIDVLEVAFGFDFETEHDKDEVVFDALLADSPLAGLVQTGEGDFGAVGERILDAQPSLAISLGERGDLQAFFEVRTKPRVPVAGDRGGDPISVFLTVRKHGPLASLDDLKGAFGAVVGHAELLAEQRVIPHIVMPIHEALQARG
ncbi:MAG: hypothetical protein ACKO0W_01655 [Planctomycetota bacterium]